MVRQPKDLAEAKQIFREEKAKLFSSLSAVAGSRWLMAILASLAVTFGVHLIYAPTRPPSLEWLRWENIGLPPSVDFGFAGEQWNEMREAAKANDVAGQVQATLAEDPVRYLWFNAAVFAVALILLFANMWIMTKRRRLTRG
jgi:hypothetical protein